MRAFCSAEEPSTGFDRRRIARSGRRYSGGGASAASKSEPCVSSAMSGRDMSTSNGAGAYAFSSDETRSG